MVALLPTSTGLRAPIHPSVDMEWADDPLVWDELDDLLLNSWPDLKRFLDAMHNHRSELNPHWRGMLFGGLGQLSASYTTARNEANNPRQAFAVALETMAANPSFAIMMQGQMNAVVDVAVEGLEGME